jgi:long-subunit fatty acid transport protein
MKFLLAILLSLSFTANASLPELFGPSAGSIAIGNQPLKNSAANNYHAPALLGYSQTTQFSFDTFYINTNFKEINNVTTKNETNTVNSSETGDVEVNPTPTTMFAVHFSTPLLSPTGPKFNFSMFAPFDRLMEADTGDPYQPRYVMYDNRFLRPILIFSLAQSFGEWSYSAGVHTGFQTNGETYFITRTTSGNPSVAKMSFNAKPSIGAALSISRKHENKTTYFTFQQEMKSKLENRASGETEIASNTSFQFDFDVAALLYYDPMTLKLGHQLELKDSTVHLSLEYQQWENFEAPTLKLKKRGGTINGSEDYEKLKLRNIWIPKIGWEKNINERWVGKIGYFYRQSPIDTNNLKNSGNTIDVDKHVGSLGLAHIFKIYDKPLTLDLAYQAHFLRSKKITKTPNREDGDASEPKIGSPGYTVGGMIHVLSTGLSWTY